MTHSSLVTKTIPHRNKFHSRGGIAISRVIIHHWASTNGGDTSLADPNRNASVNYFVYSDGTVGVQVPEEYRAWTSGGPAADLPSITIEVQNSSTQVFNGSNDDPRSWAVSDKALATLTKLIADIARRYKWGSVTRARVRGHREFDATACPGGYLWSRLSSIAANANKQLNSGGGATPAKGKEVIAYHREDKFARARGRTIEPGGGLYLNTDVDISSKATNIVGGVGQYSITPHVYAEGTPGESIDLVLIRQTLPKGKKPSNSDHYVETLVFDKDGKIKASREFKFYVGGHSPQAVYARLNAPKSNKGNVKVTLFDSDAFLFTA